MADIHRQVPGSSASARLIDLGGIEGRRFVIMRLDQSESRAALVAHIIDSGSTFNTSEAEQIVGAATARPVGAAP